MKAISLISGGLDSILAAKLIQMQYIEVVAVNFKMPFYNSLRQVDSAARYLNTELKSFDISSDFLEIIRAPLHGFGSNINPCIDCKILMLGKCKEIMQELDARFIVTGEVLGQRPMSQNREALSLIDRKSGLEDLILRPLSAKLLPVTFPERQGWVKREELLDFNGRSRRPQIRLAKQLGIKDYATPSGGCLLTDPEFARRLEELILHEELSIDNVELLKLGRHFRISPDTKLVVGRDQEENQRLLNLAKESDYIFKPQSLLGPTALGRGIMDRELINLSCRITCRYCDLNGNKDCSIAYSNAYLKEKSVFTVQTVEKEKIIELRI